MARLLRELATNVAVEYHRFSLVDVDAPTLGPAEDDGGSVVVVPNRIDFVSAGEFHRASVTLSVWQGEPQAPPGDGWDDEPPMEFESESGQVTLCGVTTGCGPGTFVLGAPGRYGLRVWCAGRDRTLLAEREGPVPAGSESYELRFWRA
jgi:hypothetical protein